MPSSQYLQKIRRKALTINTFTPCISCLAWKKKCTKVRPCPRCVKMSKSAECAAEYTLRSHHQQTKTFIPNFLTVERPISYFTHAVEFKDSPLDGWSQGPFRRLWSMGYKTETVSKIMFSLEPKIRFDVRQCLVNIQNMLAKVKVEQNEAHPIPVSCIGADFASCLVDNSRADTTGFHIIHMDPATQRCLDVDTNPHAASVLCMHR